MDTDEINTMLSLAKMDTLCAKNPIESAIIYAIEDAVLNDITEVYEHVYRILKALDIKTDFLDELKAKEESDENYSLYTKED